MFAWWPSTPPWCSRWCRACITHGSCRGGSALQPTEAPAPGRAVVEVSILVQGVLWFGGFLNLHVAELLGVKDFATLQALDKLSVFVPGNDTYPGVLADGGHRFGFGGITFSFRKIVAVFSTF